MQTCTNDENCKSGYLHEIPILTTIFYYEHSGTKGQNRLEGGEHEM